MHYCLIRTNKERITSMNTENYDKSINLLEETIIHFLTIGEYGISAELCELLLECDDIFREEKSTGPHIKLVSG